MRKALIFLALLLVLSVGGAVYLSEAVYAARDDVSVTQITHFGDPGVMAGTELTLRANYDHHLFWDVSCAFADDGAVTADTAYRYEMTKEYEMGEATFGGLYMNPDSYYLLDYNEVDPQTLQGWDRMAYDAIEATPNGTEMYHTFRLADYMDYYMWSISVDLPYPIFHTDPHDTDWLLPAERKTADEIRAFFKIPVLENEYMEISVEKDDAGNVYSMGSGSGVAPAPLEEGSEDWYNGYVHNAVTEEACFFIIHGLSSRGNPVDFSQVPGGYGIYRLPYEAHTYGKDGELTDTGIRSEQLEMVYPLPQNIEVAYFAPSPDDSRLILCTVEDGEYIFTAIDANTMETLQRFTLCTLPQDGWVNMHEEEDILVARMNAADGSEMLILLKRDEAGDYQVEFTVNAGLDLDPNGYVTSDTVMLYDGEKLFSVSLLYDDANYGHDTCDFSTRVYDETGLLYCGEYRTSLSSREEFTMWDYPIVPMNYKPLEVKR